MRAVHSECQEVYYIAQRVPGNFSMAFLDNRNIQRLHLHTVKVPVKEHILTMEWAHTRPMKRTM